MDEEGTANRDESKQENIKIQVIEDEMKDAYLDYAMSVIIGRALPEVRDGLKPVHRRILYAMNDMGMHHNKPFKKCARIVGEVLGKYHPHGDTAVYDSLVRMAQEFSLRYPLIKGQGNFGSIDGDNAAAMRYTEAKLSKISDDILKDIEKETVEMVPNFDESLKEPYVLPTRIPNLLVNGSNGIAVGMATNIPPHNLKEVCGGAIAILENEDIEILELVEIVKGPDLPTGGILTGTSGILQAYSTGRGKAKIKAKTHFEDKKGKQILVIDEIPYQVNKSMLLEQIAECVRDKRVEGISDIRDESDRDGMRVVIELKRDSNNEVVLNQLMKHTRLQITLSMIFLAIKDKQPMVLNLKEILISFLDHRKDIIIKRTTFDLNKAKKKFHILEGLVIALDNIDAVIKLIKEAENASTAKELLITNYSLSEEQSQAILDMKLQRLTGLEQDKIKDDLKTTLAQIKDFEDILSNPLRVKSIIKEELEEVIEKYGDERKTQIVEGEDEDIDMEDLIPPEDVIVTLTHSGYTKRLSLETYKVQNRGGKGIIGASMKEEDVVEHLFVANTHSYLLIFTDKGKIYWLKVYRIPESSRQSKGKAIINLIDIESDEKVTSVIPVKEFTKTNNLVMITKNGIIKKTELEAYSRPRKGGIIGINLDDGDKLVKTLLTDGNNEILIGTKKGVAARFHERDARVIGRTSRGVRGISLRENDSVIGAIIGDPNKEILTITENGYGKRTKIEDYRIIKRGGKGVINIICSQRNGNVVGIQTVDDNDDVICISGKGIVMRTRASDISTIGRNTQGLRIMRLNNDDKVRTLTKTKNQ